MSDIVTSKTETENTRMELILALVQRELKDQAVVAPTLRDVSAFAEEGASSIEFPKATSFEVKKKQPGEKAASQALTFTTDKLPLDEHAYVKWIIEKKSRIQSRVALLQSSIRRATSAHARGVDNDVIAAMVANASSDNNVTFSSAITRANILDMRKALDDKNVPSEGRVLLVNPQEERDMLDISDFIDASKYGSQMPIQNGEFGRIYGTPVLKSNLIDANTALMYHPEGIVLGFQSSPEFDEQKDLDNIGRKYLIDQLYGYKVLDSGVYISKLA